MKWSLLVGRFWGAEIRLHVSLLLLIPYGLVVFHPSDLGGTVRVTVLIAAIFACVTLHEIGHTIAARLSGIQVTSIVLWPLGGFANLSRRPEKLLPDLFISVAGPLANLLIFAILALVTVAEVLVENSMAVPSLSFWLNSAGVYPVLFSLAIANLGLALFNLVPVFPLDGGQIARSILKALFGEKRADQVMILFSLPLAMGLVGVGVAINDLAVVLTGLLLVLAAATLDIRLANGMTLVAQYIFDRGNYYLRREDFDAAVGVYTREIQRFPNRAGLHVSRAVVWMNLMDLGQARADIDRALALDPASPIAWGLHGEMLALGKQYDLALEAFNRAIALRPGWAVAYLDRGGVYQDQDDLKRAAEDMNKGVDLGHGSPVAYLLRSILRFKLNEREDARKDADQAMRYAPTWMLTFPEIFLNNLEGNLDWALEYYWRAIERMPNAYQSYQGRADACRVNHRPAWAVEDYHRAIRLAPRNARLYLSRGLAFQQLGSLEQAAQDFREAARLAERSHLRRQAESWLATLVGSIPAQPPGSHPATPESAAVLAPSAPVEPPEAAAKRTP